MHATRPASSPTLLEEVLQQLQSRMRPEQFATWFRGFHLVSDEDDEIEFAVPSGFARDWLVRHYLGLIEESVTAVRGSRVRVKLGLDTADELALADTQPRGTALDLSVRPQEGQHENGEAAACELDSNPSVRPPAAPDQARPRTPGPAASVVDKAMLSFGAVPPSARAETDAQESQSTGLVGNSCATAGGSGLNPNYTFEEFVVGPCNRLAHAAALAIGENPGRAFNPLFIHGNVGLGKTHLLQAICDGIHRKRGDVRVLYLSCEEFTNRFIRSIRHGRLDEFREFHRTIEVLVIDDVQFLAGKEKTQEEFFHTFNALYNAQRQIVISSDRSPLDISTVEERLVSRFKWGLVADMEMPCFETRVAIVKRKARSRGVDFSDDLAYCVAERINTNIRELEGAVIKIIGVATITERELDVALAEEALRGVSIGRSRQVSLAEIMDLITGDFSIPAREITGKSRTQAVSLPRQIGMYLSRELTEHSLEEVGRFFGNRDHTTVLYAVQKIKKRCKDDRMFRELLGNLSERLRLR